MTPNDVLRTGLELLIAFAIGAFAEAVLVAVLVVVITGTVCIKVFREVKYATVSGRNARAGKA